MRSKLVDCGADQTACMTTYNKNIAGEFWDNACITQTKCDRFVQTYADHCPKHDESICVTCCNTTGCMGQAGRGVAGTVKASTWGAMGTLVTTAVLAVMNHF
ncbi:uncharacterized protein LOC144868861 [Branchiostoma floridae x Branchiostoma japonicum]